MELLFEKRIDIHLIDNILQIYSKCFETPRWQLRCPLLHVKSIYVFKIFYKEKYHILQKSMVLVILVLCWCCIWLKIIIVQTNVCLSLNIKKHYRPFYAKKSCEKSHVGQIYTLNGKKTTAAAGHDYTCRRNMGTHF